MTTKPLTKFVEWCRSVRGTHLNLPPARINWNTRQARPAESYRAARRNAWRANGCPRRST
jgi:hypothetical protein